MGTQQFCLRWNNHQINLLNVFDQLLQSGDFVDVTLACEGVSLKAHKMVLSACSPYFQSLFKENPCKHPIVIMKDIRYSELKAIVDFMYKGEINVSQEQLPTLLKTAEALKVKGLADMSDGNGVPGSGGSDSVSSVQETSAVPLPSQQQQQHSDPNSPSAPSDGRASPHSKRKRHRPSRRPSNSDSNTEPLPSSDRPDLYELPRDMESRTIPKIEPVELLSEPPVEMIMGTDPHYQMDMGMVTDNRTQDSQDSNSTNMLQASDGMLAGLSQTTMTQSSMQSQPSTSGTQSTSQDYWYTTPSGNDGFQTVRPAPPSYTKEDVKNALARVEIGDMNLTCASRMFGIPIATLWRKAKQRGFPMKRRAFNKEGFAQP